MKTGSVNSFKGNFYSNGYVLKALKYASDNPAIVETGAALALASAVRPLSILMTPKTEKREKEYMASKSVISSAVSFALASLIFKPVSKAMDTIEKSPSQFLTQKTIDTLKTSGEALEASKPFNYIKQTIKYTPVFLSIVPKALLTTALIVPVLEFVFGKDKDKEKEQNKIDISISQPKSAQSFQGASLAKFIAKPINSAKIQNFAIKHQNSNLFFNIISLKDVFATGVFAFAAQRNKKIDEKNKKPLIINSVLSTAMTIAGGIAADKLTQKPFEKFLDNISKANVNDINLPKYIEGAKVLKPIVILGTLYYGVIPPVSTFISGKLAHLGDNNK